MTRWYPPRWLHWPRFQPEHLLRQQLTLIDAQSTTPIIVAWITAGATLWIFHRLDALLAWVIWFVLYTLMFVAMYFAFASSRRRRMAPSKRVWIIIVGYTALGLMWGVQVIMVALAGGDFAILAMVATIVASIASAVLGFCGSCFPVYLGFLLAAGSAVNVGFLLYDSSLAKMLSAFAVLYVLTMLHFARNSERAALRLIELRFENRVLVTQLRTQTQQAEAAREQAEASNVDKSRFLAAASHDLRQPVHALGLFLEALKNTQLDDRQRVIHSKAQSACDASGEMLGTLLDFSRIEAGVVKYEPRAFALQPLLAELEREYLPQAETQRLDFRLRNTSLRVVSDPQLVSLVLRNLISNAVRYTRRGGVLIGCRQQGVRAVVEVWDTGIGINPLQHTRIFTEFVQLENLERNRAQGLGLGLAIVKKLADQMNARVTLRSAPGRGSVFALSLPCALGSSPTDPAIVVPSVLSSLAGLRVLVVDDEQDVREAMQQLLASWGCACRSTGNLHGALVSAKEAPPDVVLTDYRLRDGVTGRDVIRAVRAAVGGHLPCIIVTGDTAPERLRDAAEVDAVLLHKPLPAAQLRAALSACCTRSSPIVGDR